MCILIIMFLPILVTSCNSNEITELKVQTQTLENTSKGNILKIKQLEDSINQKDVEINKLKSEKVKENVSVKENITTITKEIFFTITDSKSLPISDVKIVIININGDVVDVETSDKNGRAEGKITVPIDKRYYWLDPNKMEPRGTVTVIAFKEGYLEQVLFEVPVSSATSGGNFFLKAVTPGGRNEPDVQLGSTHHLEILSLVDKYAKYFKR